MCAVNLAADLIFCLISIKLNLAVHEEKVSAAVNLAADFILRLGFIQLFSAELKASFNLASIALILFCFVLKTFHGNR